MQSNLPMRGTPLSQQIARILIERIRNGRYSPDAQLPPEKDLAEEFKVSRATVRTAIGVLAARGLVIPRQGVGTFVSRLSRVSNPLNEALDFHEIIAGEGHAFGVQVVRVAQMSPDPRAAEQLQVDPTEPVLRWHKIFTADGRPVVFSITDLPGWLVDGPTAEAILARPEVTDPLSDFLKDRLGQSVEYHVANLRSETVRNCPFPDLPFDPTTPVLVIEEVAFNADERPIWHAVEYFPGNAMTFELIRYRSR